MTDETWQLALSGFAAAAVVAMAALVWLRRTAARREATVAGVREQLGDLARLPGRLRRVAADPRTPRRARWWLLGLAVYVASPIDPIPDFLPGVGFLDELVVVPLVLDRVRRSVPPAVWADHFPPGRHDRVGERPAAPAGPRGESG